MKTSVEIDEKKLKIAKSFGGAQTLRELIDQALDAFINEQKRRSISRILGTGMISGNLDEMRGRKRDRVG